MSKIVIVNTSVNGHHPFYLALIIKSLIEHSKITVLGELTKSVRHYLDRYSVEPSSVKWVQPDGNTMADFYAQSLSVAKQENASIVFYAFFDHFIEYVLLEDRPVDHEVAGIWFHPYALDPKYGRRFGSTRNKYRKLIHSKLRNKATAANIRKIFFLDPDGPKKLTRVNPNIIGRTLPDPGESNPTMDQSTARQYFKLPGKEKIIFLHVGTSEKRKGLSDTIEAFHRGLSNRKFRERAFLLRVGMNDRLSAQDRTRLLELVNSGNASLVEGYVPEDDFIEYFSAADVILIPYRKFRFSSGILVNAINVGRPILASNYGMIGEAVMKMDSGRCFRHRSVSSLSKALVAQCQTEPAVVPGTDTVKDQVKFMRLITDTFEAETMNLKT